MNIIRDYVRECLSELKLDKGLIKRTRRASAETAAVKQKMSTIGRSVAQGWLLDRGIALDRGDQADAIRYAAMQYMRIYNGSGEDHDAATQELYRRLDKRYARSIQHQTPQETHGDA